MTAPFTAVPELLPLSEYHEDYGCVLFFHFESFEELPEVYCGSPLEVEPPFDESYWTHFVRFDFNKIFDAAIAASTQTRNEP